MGERKRLLRDFVNAEHEIALVLQYLRHPACGCERCRAARDLGEAAVSDQLGILLQLGLDDRLAGPAAGRC